MSLIVLGVIFAALQVREEALARRVKAITLLYSDVWPPEAARALLFLAGLPQAFKGEDITEEQRQSVTIILYHYNRAVTCCGRDW